MNEYDTIKAALESAGLPESVADVKFDLYDDWSGDPAVGVYLIFADSEVASPEFFDRAEEASERVRTAIRGTGTNRWPYVRVRTVAEEAELLAGD
jgi:hypothetical protein